MNRAAAGVRRSKAGVRVNHLLGDRRAPAERQKNLPPSCLLPPDS
jgi:hypothetical protein